MPQATDEQLIASAKKERSLRLAAIYLEIAQHAECVCKTKHDERSSCCPRAAWQQAARMAEMIDNHGRG